MIDIDDGVCYCYINSLMKSENPANLLRMAWYASNFVHENLLNVDSENNMLEKYQKNEIRVKGILNKMLVQSKERFATLNQLTENFKAADADIRDCLNEEIRDVRTQHIEVIESWWNSNLIKQEGHKLKSTEIHKKFISYEENRRHGIDVDMFKQILRSIPSLKSEEIVRGKTDKAMYVIVGYKFL
jgi:Ca2+-binding EF-hand superfamily protein